MVLDTHVGARLYDLSSDEARATGEADRGIAAVIDKTLPARKAAPVSAPEFTWIRQVGSMVRSANCSLLQML
jgi:23S rRNA A2030 N6-methylase RlmJ